MSEHNPTSEVTKSPLAKLADVLANWDCDTRSTDKELRDSDTRELAGAFSVNREHLDGVISQAHLTGVADDGRFFSFFAKASRRIERGDGKSALLGAIWARVYEKSSIATREKLLSGFLTDRDFFTPLYSVAEFVAQSDLSGEKLSEWFIQIRNRLGNDGALGGLWRGIQSLADHHPESALEVLRLWLVDRPSEELITMAASLLGRLRFEHADKTFAIDKYLSNHSDNQLRIVFYRSWIGCDQQSSMKFKDYRELVERMTVGTPEEISEALHFIRCTLTAEHRCEDSFELGMRWLSANAPRRPDGTWAHWIISLACSCDERAYSMSLPLCRDLIPQLLPIPAGHDGTWQELETLLVKLLLEDRAAFEELLFEIARRDRKGIVEKFAPHGGFYDIPTLMRQHMPAATIAQALNSLDESVRHLGVRLFCSLGVEDLPPAVLGKWSDEWISVLICQVQIESFMDSGGLQFLRALAERVSQGSDSLKSFFIEELVWQMKNLPGACLEPAKGESEKLSSDSLLRRAVSEAEQYFEKLKPCYRSAINSMEVAGYRRAQRIESRKRNRQVSESAEKSSPLLSMISKSYTLYGGKQWQTYIGGTLAQPSTMQKFSHSVEFPRMLVLDPDGHAQRLRHAAHLAREIVTNEEERRALIHDS